MVYVVFVVFVVAIVESICDAVMADRTTYKHFQ